MFLLDIVAPIFTGFKRVAQSASLFSKDMETDDSLIMLRKQSTNIGNQYRIPHKLPEFLNQGRNLQKVCKLRSNLLWSG